jgi:RNA polymerase sigma factor for flagellar operon FliA
MDTVDAEAMFLRHLKTIDRIVAFSSKDAGRIGIDFEDFGSFVKLKLIENDYAIVRKFEGRCSFATYLSIVIRRFLLDYRVSLWGKWHASAEAQRRGDVGVAIESMIMRDGMTVAEALPALRRRWPELTANEVATLVERLPHRIARPREVEIELAHDVANDDDVDAMSFETNRVALGQRIAAVVRDGVRSFVEDDRLLCRLRFEGGLSIAEIARVLRVDQKPLYRRLQRVLVELRRRLMHAGIDASIAEEVLESRVGLDFEFLKEAGESSASRPSNDREGSGEGEAP